MRSPAEACRGQAGRAGPQDEQVARVLLIALAVLALSMVLYVAGRVGQDKLPSPWRTRLAEDELGSAESERH